MSAWRRKSEGSSPLLELRKYLLCLYSASILMHQRARETWEISHWSNLGGQHALLHGKVCELQLGLWHGSGEADGETVSEKMCCVSICHTWTGSAKQMRTWPWSLVVIFAEKLISVATWLCRCVVATRERQTGIQMRLHSQETVTESVDPDQ
jgi:hypothetical protein